MRKSNFFVKYFKNISSFINILLEKNLNKLNFHNLRNLTKNNIIILSFVAFSVLFVSYLLLPTFYNKSEVSVKLKSELIEKFKINFNISDNFTYNLFPRPHFNLSNASITHDQIKISNIKNLKIYVSAKNLYSIKNLEINDVVINNANFNLNNKNYDFFIKILKNDFSGTTLKIKNSNIFFRSNENEVMFINKIIDLKYYYDSKEFKNLVYSKNEIFNAPYTIELYQNEKEKKFHSKINLNLFKIQIENEHNFKNDPNYGISNLINNKKKSMVKYKTSKNFFEFDYFDKLENPSFLYNGVINFNPFYSSFEGKTDQFNINYFFDSNSIINQLFKTEILNNKNLDFKFKINAKNIYNNKNFKKLNLKSKIQDGLIDFDETSLNWNNVVDFKLTESLIYVKDGVLVLDGKLNIKIKNYNEIYKYLITPKNYRNKIENINFNFIYNFDQKIAKLSDIKIDNKMNLNVNKILSSFVFKKDNLQNKIYFKNLLNEAIKSYAG